MVEREHETFGIGFGSGFGERLDRLDEAVGLIRRLLAGERVTHDGRFYRLREAICAPLPIQGAAADAILRARCAELGRDPADIERFVYQNVVVRDTAEAAAASWDGWRARHDPSPGEDKAELLGPPDEVSAHGREGLAAMPLRQQRVA